MSRGRLLVEAIDREHRRTQAQILARAAASGAPESAAPSTSVTDDAAIHPQTWLE